MTRTDFQTFLERKVRGVLIPSLKLQLLSSFEETFFLRVDAHEGEHFCNCLETTKVGLLFFGAPEGKEECKRNAHP